MLCHVTLCGRGLVVSGSWCTIIFVTAPMTCLTDKAATFEMQQLSFWLEVKRSQRKNYYRHAPSVISCHFLLVHLGVRYQKCPPDNWLVNVYFFCDGYS